MEEYRLLTKDRETINAVKCNSFEEAIEYFAEKKKLSRTDLIRIFDVDIYTTLPTGGTFRSEKR
jgi:hypothetical protein